MLLYTKKMNLFFYSALMLIFFISCNSSESKEMKQFVSGKVEKINKNDNSTALRLKDESGVMIFSTIFKDSLDNYSKTVENLKVGQSIKIKGVIYDFPSKSSKRDITDFFKDENGDNELELIVIKDIKFTDSL